jgi:hypothetical protein
MVLIKEDTIKKGNSNYLKEIESGLLIAIKDAFKFLSSQHSEAIVIKC